MKWHHFIVQLGLVASLHAAPFNEGTITFITKRGKLEQTFQYTKKGELVRLEKLGKHAPAPPINLINQKTGDFKILRPLNSSWLQVPAEMLKPRKTSAFPEPPAPPAGIGAKPTPPGAPAPPAPPSEAAPKAPQIPKAPKFPQPKLPEGVQLPKGIGPQPNGGNTNPTGQPAGQTIPGVPQAPSIPGVPGGGAFPGGMPPMPSMPGQSEELTLTKQDETKTIHGYLCQRYLMTIPRRGEMTLWLSDAKDLPPFHLLLHEAPRMRGRVRWEQQWPALLREKKLFPMLVVMHAESRERPNKKEKPAQGRELYRYEVSKVKAGAVSDPEDKLFTVPAKYYKSEPIGF